MFIVGKFEQLKNQLDKTLNWFRDSFLKVRVSEEKQKSDLTDQVEGTKLRELLILVKKAGPEAFEHITSGAFREGFIRLLSEPEPLLFKPDKGLLLSSLNLDFLQGFNSSQDEIKPKPIEFDFSQDSLYPVPIIARAVEIKPLEMVYTEDMFAHLYLQNKNFKKLVDNDDNTRSKFQKSIQLLAEKE